jgi:hypothetical protein
LDDAAGRSSTTRQGASSIRSSSGAGRTARGRLLLGLVIVLAAALLWAGLLADQFPCFLGAPNCE